MRLRPSFVIRDREQAPRRGACSLKEEVHVGG